MVFIGVPLAIFLLLSVLGELLSDQDAPMQSPSETTSKPPESGEGISQDTYQQKIFEWAYPEVANWCKSEGKRYPELNEKGEIIDELPRTEKMRY